MSVKNYHINKGYPEEDFKGLSAEYTKHFIDYYNKEQFSAFSAIINYRDESERRIKELKEEIEFLIEEVKKEFKNYRSVDYKGDDAFEIMSELKPYLENLKKRPNNRLKRILDEILEDEDLYYDCKINRVIIDNVKGLLDKLYKKSFTLKRVVIIKGSAKLLINQIIDWGAPLKINRKKSVFLIRSLLPNEPVTKPKKETIYEWYDALINEGKDVKEAFNQLKTEIVAQGLKINDYIKTDTPENFQRSYNKWLKNNKLRNRN